MTKNDNVLNGAALGGTAGIPFGVVGIIIGAIAVTGLYFVFRK